MFVCLCNRQVNEIIEETKEQDICQNDKNKSESYISLDNTSDDANLKNIRDSVIEKVSESIPAPGEPLFVINLVEQEVTPDSELSNAM